MTTSREIGRAITSDTATACCSLFVACCSLFDPFDRRSYPPDKGYDYRRCRDACVRRGVKHRIARKGVDSKTKLGTHRWIVERTLAWLAGYRRLAVRYERLVAVHRAWLHLACAPIRWNQLQRV